MTPASARRKALAASTGKIDEMLACVRASGLKLTPQRMAIVRELAADPTHPTAQELFERLRPALPTMSFATVYNTLDALASAGLCASLSLAPGPARFDPNMRAHHHVVCDHCGMVRDVLCDEIGSAAGSTALPASIEPGFELRAVERIYRGLCSECATENGVQSSRGRRDPCRSASE
jgi:Fe2+ or Zn2+ uptake regulation protein